MASQCRRYGRLPRLADGETPKRDARRARSPTPRPDLPLASRAAARPRSATSSRACTRRARARSRALLLIRLALPDARRVPLRARRRRDRHDRLGERRRSRWPRLVGGARGDRRSFTPSSSAPRRARARGLSHPPARMLECTGTSLGQHVPARAGSARGRDDERARRLHVRTLPRAHPERPREGRGHQPARRLAGARRAPERTRSSRDSRCSGRRPAHDRSRARAPGDRRGRPAREFLPARARWIALIAAGRRRAAAGGRSRMPSPRRILAIVVAAVWVWLAPAGAPSRAGFWPAVARRRAGRDPRRRDARARRRRAHRPGLDASRRRAATLVFDRAVLVVGAARFLARVGERRRARRARARAGQVGADAPVQAPSGRAAVVAEPSTPASLAEASPRRAAEPRSSRLPTVRARHPDAALRPPALKGGRLIGPLERILVFVADARAMYPLIAAILAAKGIVRFPEINRDSAGRQSRRVLPDRQSVSWVIALAAAFLVWWAFATTGLTPDRRRWPARGIPTPADNLARVSAPLVSATAPANDPTFENVWDEIVWRGLVHVSTDQEALRALLAGDPITYYCGFDPTAPSLHLGNLVQLLLMRRLQLAGPQAARSRRRLDRPHRRSAAVGRAHAQHEGDRRRVGRLPRVRRSSGS